MNFLNILQGRGKASSHDVAKAIVELEGKRDSFIDQAGPLKAELKELSKQDLAGEEVSEALRKKRAVVSELTEKIEAAEESISELKGKLLERLHGERADRLEAIDREVKDLRAESAAWRTKLIIAQARCDAIHEYIEPLARGFNDPYSRDYTPDEKRFYRLEFQKARDEIGDTASIKARLSSVLQERSALSLSQASEEDGEALIEQARAQ
jgi:chromosome segregation ATPase